MLRSLSKEKREANEINFRDDELKSFAMKAITF